MVESKNILCIKCKTEYTDEEMALHSKTCWFCLAAELKKLDEIDAIPDPTEYGRPNGYAELAKRENVKALQAIAAAQSKRAQEVPEEQANTPVPADVAENIKITYGVDVTAKIPTTVITVKGKNDETYMQFSVRGQVSPALKKEFERIMKNMLELFGTLLSFGENFGGTVAGLRLLTMDQFFKQ